MSYISTPVFRLHYNWRRALFRSEGMNEYFALWQWPFILFRPIPSHQCYTGRSQKVFLKRTLVIVPGAYGYLSTWRLTTAKCTSWETGHFVYSRNGIGYGGSQFFHRGIHKICFGKISRNMAISTMVAPRRTSLGPLRERERSGEKYRPNETHFGHSHSDPIWPYCLPYGMGSEWRLV